MAYRDGPTVDYAGCDEDTRYDLVALLAFKPKGFAFAVAYRDSQHGNRAAAITFQGIANYHLCEGAS